MPWLRPFLLAIAIVAAMVAASFAAGGDDAWPRAVLWAQRQRAALARDAGLPALSPPQPGDAAALRAQIGQGFYAGESGQELMERALAGEPVDGEQLTRVLQGLAGDLAALRAAAHAKTAADAIDDAGCAGLGDAASAALLMARASEPAEAAAIWADLLWNGLALANGKTALAQLLGAHLIESTAAAIRPEDVLALPEAAASRLLLVLADIDAALRPESALPRLAMLAQVEALAGPMASVHGDLRNRLLAWRHGFSPLDQARAEAATRIAALQQFERSAAATAAWPERRAGLLAMAASLRMPRRGSFPEADTCMLRAAEHEEQRRVAVAQLRLLRQELAWRLGQELPALDDPLGRGPFAVSATRAAIVVQSSEPRLVRTCRR